jgi:hypothetical protein
MLGRFYSSLSTLNKETFITSRTFIITTLTNAADRLNTMDNPVTPLDDLLTSTPEPRRAAKEPTPVPASEETLVERDTGAKSDIEVARVS